MQAFPEFRHMPTAFWAMIKYISETLLQRIPYAILPFMMVLLDLMMIPEDWYMYLMIKTISLVHPQDVLMVRIRTSSIQE